MLLIYLHFTVDRGIFYHSPNTSYIGTDDTHKSVDPTLASKWSKNDGIERDKTT